MQMIKNAKPIVGVYIHTYNDTKRKKIKGMIKRHDKKSYI